MILPDSVKTCDADFQSSAPVISSDVKKRAGASETLSSYSVKGEGFYRAGANGNPVSMELFHAPKMQVFNGMMTAIVQTNGKPGDIILTASGKGLKAAKIVIKAE